jgi:hypothetical protein
MDLRGPIFETWDQRALSVQLVRAGLAEAVCFPFSGSPLPPIELLYKKAVVLAPGTFEDLNLFREETHERMLASAVQQLRRELGEKDLVPVSFYCLSAAPLRAEDELPDTPDMLQRIDALLARGADVLLFRERELYTMTDLVNRYTKQRVRFVVSLSLLIRVFEYRYSKLAGSLLEALSRLLAQNVRIYAWPMISRDLQRTIQSISATGWEWTDTNGWVSAAQLRLSPPRGHLYNYVLASNFLVPLQIAATSTANG